MNKQLTKHLGKLRDGQAAIKVKVCDVHDISEVTRDGESFILFSLPPFSLSLIQLIGRYIEVKVCI